MWLMDAEAEASTEASPLLRLPPLLAPHANDRADPADSLDLAHHVPKLVALRHLPELDDRVLLAAGWMLDVDVCDYGVTADQEA